MISLLKWNHLPCLNQAKKRSHKPKLRRKKWSTFFSCRWSIDDINGSPVVQDLSEKQALENSHLIHLDVDKTKPQLDYKQDIFVFAD